MTTPGAPNEPGPRKLNKADAWDALVLAEAALLERWTGIRATLVHSTDGTAAGSDFTVYIDRAELNRYFGSFTGEKYKTAIFFALAHEFGHLCQFHVYGVDDAFKMPSKEAEAHADYLSGAWLGLRLTQGEERLSEDVFAAGLQLKGNIDDYPTSYQRGRLIEDAMGKSVLLVHVLEPQIQDADYQKLEVALEPGDVKDLYDIAKKLLEELPEDNSWERLVRPSLRGLLGRKQ